MANVSGGTVLPTVSVAIASYNYGRYLGDSIRSALNQEGVDVEVIVVDDCSSDNSVEVASEIARKDSRVRLLVHDRNHGHIATFNESLWSGHGEFLVKLDSDDMLTPGSLRRSAAVLQENPSVGFVYGHPLTFERELPAARSGRFGVRIWRGDEWIRTRCRRSTNVIMQPEAMVRASVLRQTDGHRPHLPATHDFNLWLRLAAIADVGRVQGVDQGYYRVHPDSLLRSQFGGFYADLVGRQAAFDDFFDTLTPAQSARLGAETLRGKNHRTLAKHALRYAVRAYDAGLTSTEPVEQYEAFAEALHPDKASLILSKQLQMRKLLGPEKSSSLSLFQQLERARVVQDSIRWRRWKRFGT